MTLGTHAVAGALAAQLFPSHPVLGFAAGFVSHFAMDAIPHGHYKLHSKNYKPDDRLGENMTVKSRAFLVDLFHAGIDAGAGIIIALIIFGVISPIQALAGAVGGILPDLLQFVYFKTKFEPFITLQKFHIKMHSKKSLNENLAAAIAVEGSVIIFAVIVGRLFI